MVKTLEVAIQKGLKLQPKGIQQRSSFFFFRRSKEALDIPEKKQKRAVSLKYSKKSEILRGIIQKYWRIHLNSKGFKPHKSWKPKKDI